MKPNSLKNFAVKVFAILLLAGLPGFSLFGANARIASASAVSAAPNDLVVQFKTDLNLSSDPNIVSVKKLFAWNSSPQFKNIFEIHTTYSLAQFSAAYSGKINYVNLQHLLKAGTVTVNDPGFTLDPSNVNRQWGLAKARFPDAWDKTKGTSSTIIAEIDTGIDATHEDLSNGQITSGFNFLNGTVIPFGENSDDDGHGTLVAGVIGATANNFRGVVGGTWNATIMPLKALDASGQGNSADVASAIVWAADHNANIINMSLGGVGFGNDTTLSNAISYAFNKGVVLVSAAGNDVATTGGNLDQEPVFPICDDNGQNMIIGVAATDENDQKASFSNFGKACVDVSAPGKHILSTINRDPITHELSPNTYAYASGTSLATPFVSAEAALIKAQYPSASNREIRDRIIKSADPIDQFNVLTCGNQSCAGLLGSGRINAYAALDPNLLPSISDGTLVQPQGQSIIYLITGGQKQQVSPFVQQQRFSGVTPQVVPPYLLDSYPTGPFALPNDGTIVKANSSPTVYMIMNGFKRPITYQVYLQRGIQPNQVNVVGDDEINSWVSGNFLSPVEGTLVKAGSNPTVYWVVDSVLHPINYAFWIDRGLKIFPIMVIAPNDLKNYAQGNAFIR